jgi:hypothetical protein
MDRIGFQLEREDPHHFVARNAKGDEVRIAKKGLSKAAHERYQKLCRGGEAKAEGGEIEPQRPESEAPRREPVDLSRVRLVKESDTHFHLKDHRGPFSVAKKGLSKAMHAKIQAFAEGGQADAEPVPASFPPEEVLASYQPPPGDAGAPSETPAAPAEETPPPAPVERVGAVPTEPVVDVRTGRRVMLEQPPPVTEPTPEGRAAMDAMLASRGGPPPPGDAVAPIPSHGPAPTAALVSSHESSPAVAAYQATSEKPPASEPQTPTLPGMPGIPKAPDIAQTQKQVADAYASAQAAEQAKVDVAKNEAAETLKVQQHLEDQRQALQKDWTAKLAGWQTRGDELRQAILDQKVDPERYWKDANGDTNVGRKVKAALGLIFGGMGSGLTHQPNAALSVIQSAIERDVDAQKTEIGKKTTLLGMHLQEGHTLMAARQMAIADMKDAAAAQLSMVSTKFVGDKAQAAAQANIAALQRSAAMDRQQVATQGFDMQFKAAQVGIARAQAAREQAMFPLQYEQAVLGRNMARLQFGALQGLTAGGGGAGAGAGSSMGTRIDPRAIPFLPKEYREALVTLPDGSYALAKTPKAAEETQKAIESAGLLRDKMARYGALLAKHPHGVSSTLSPEDYETAKALHASILTDINGLAGLNRFTETEAGIYSQRVPDITSKQVRAVGHQAKLAELGKEIDDKISQSNRSWLNLPSRKRTLQ